MDFCLSYLNDKILKGFEKGMMTGMIVIDLQKAFHTIDRDVLLQKLYAIGFSKHTVKRTLVRIRQNQYSLLLNLKIKILKNLT